MEGVLQKKNKLIGWSSRFFVVSNATRSLVQYKDASKTEVRAAPAACHAACPSPSIVTPLAGHCRRRL